MRIFVVAMARSKSAKRTQDRFFRLIRRLTGALIVSLAITAGSCHPPLESRLPLSEPGEAEIDPRFVGTWGYFQPGNGLTHILRIAAPEQSVSLLMLQNLYGEPPLYLTAHPTEVAGATIFNVRRIGGIGNDYTLMARNGCRAFSPAHEPGYMLFWAELSEDGEHLRIHNFDPPSDDASTAENGIRPSGLARSAYTNELYATTSVIELDPRSVLRYIALQEETGYHSYLEPYYRRNKKLDVYALKRLDATPARISVPMPFAAKTEALMEVAFARYNLGDLAGFAASYEDIAPVIDCLGADKLDEQEMQTYLALLVHAGKTDSAWILFEALDENDREEARFVIANALLQTGDLEGAHRTRDELTEPDLRQWLDYFEALAATERGDLQGALAALDRLPGPRVKEGVHALLIADQYSRLGENDRVERILQEAAALLLPPDGSGSTYDGYCDTTSDTTNSGERKAYHPDIDEVLLTLIALDRREPIRRIFENVRKCPIEDYPAEEYLALILHFGLVDGEYARWLAKIADAMRDPDEADSRMLDWIAAIALAGTDQPNEALRLLEAAGRPKSAVSLAESEEEEFLHALALGATMGAMARTGNAQEALELARSHFLEAAHDPEQAELHAYRAIVATLAATDIRALHRMILEIPIVAKNLPKIVVRMSGGQLVTHPLTVPRVVGLRGAVIGDPIAQELLSEARAKLAAARAVAGSEFLPSAAEIGMPWLDFGTLADYLLAPERPISRLMGATEKETESLASPSIRVTNHIYLAATVAALGDAEGAHRLLDLAHQAALQLPATGAREHGDEGLHIGVTIR